MTVDAIDLFAGAGGTSTGAVMAGVRVLAASFAAMTSPRTWLRRAAAKRSP